MYRLTRTMSGTRRGGKARRALKTSRPTTKQLLAKYYQDSTNGGRNATSVQLPEFCTRIVNHDTVPPPASLVLFTVGQLEVGEIDFVRLSRLAHCSPGRKGVPNLELPMEIWRMLLNPE